MKKLDSIFIFVITSLLLYFVLGYIHNSFCKDSVREKEQNIIVASSEFIRVAPELNNQYKLFVIDTNLGREKIAYQIDGVFSVKLLRRNLIENGFTVYNSFFKINDAFSFSKNGYRYLIKLFPEKKAVFFSDRKRKCI